MSKERDYAFRFFHHLEEISKDCLKSLNAFEKSYSETDVDNPENMLNSQEKRCAESLLEKTLENYQETVALIDGKLKRKSFAKIDKVEASLLLLGATELLAGKTPPKVVINEYVSLAKKYGTQKSFAFVNGVLDAIYKAK